MIPLTSQQGPGHAASEIKTLQIKQLGRMKAGRAAALAASFLPGGKNCRSPRAKAGRAIASRECGLYERLTF
jgi:hypothetical protein